MSSALCRSIVCWLVAGIVSTLVPALAQQPVRISGQITLAPDGVGLPIVWVRGLPGGIVTDADGRFAVEVPLFWDGTLEPWLPGYRFEPESMDVSNVADHTAIDFVAIERPPGYSKLWWLEDGDEIPPFPTTGDLVWLEPGIYDETDVHPYGEGITFLGAGADLVTVRERTRSPLFLNREGPYTFVEGIHFESVSDAGGKIFSEAGPTRLRRSSIASVEDEGLYLGGVAENSFEVLLESVDATGDFASAVIGSTSVPGEIVGRSMSLSESRDGLVSTNLPELDLVLENLDLRSISDDGVDLEINSVTARNVLVSNVGDDAFRFLGPTQAEIHQATIVGSGDAGVYVGTGTSASFFDSIFFENGRLFAGSGGLTFDHVLENDTDPLFVDSPDGDYHLRPESPARAAGRNGQDLGVYGGPLGSWDETSPFQRPTLRRLAVRDLLRRHLTPGSVVQLQAIGLFNRGYVGPVDGLVTWSSSNPSVLIHRGSGAFEAVAVGSVTVTLEAEGISAEIELQVVEDLAFVEPPQTIEADGRPANPTLDLARERRALDGTRGSRPTPSARSKLAGGEATWQPTGPLNQARYDHAATLLLDGRVLVSGGRSGTTLLASSEVYEPASGTWRPVKAMNRPREEHAAVLLGDGRVLVVGGAGETSAELYDPVNDLWVEAASSQVARSRPTATLLTDGRVLVVGGTLASPQAEIYDPGRDLWLATGPTSSSYLGHSATRLLDGRVLVINGSTPELYTPGQGWQDADPLPFSLDSPTATRLPDGRVVVVSENDPLRPTLIYQPDGGAGTWTTADPGFIPRRDGPRSVLLSDGRVLLFGGDSASTLAEIWDPATEAWSATASASSARRYFTLTTLSSGEVLMAGGRGSVSTTRCDLFQTASLPATVGPSLFESRSQAGVVTLPDGRILVVGGFNKGETAGVEIFDPVALSWSIGPPTGTASPRSAIVLHDGDVLAVSRYNAERFDPEHERWSLTGPRQTPGFLEPTLVLLATGEVLSVTRGGAEIYDPVNDEWSLTGPMQTPRDFPSLSVLPTGDVLAAGGDSQWQEALATAEIFDVRTRMWRSAATMHVPRSDHRAVVIASGEILVVGGDDDLFAHSSAEIYDPQSDTWRLTGTDMINGRSEPAVISVGAEVWVIGGEGENRETFSSTEIYDPMSDRWRPGPDLATSRARAAVASLAGGDLLVIGGRTRDEYDVWRPLNTVERLHPRAVDESRRPEIVAAPDVIRFGESFRVDVAGPGSGSLWPEGHGGRTGDGAFEHPVLELRSLADGRSRRLQPSLRPTVGLTSPSWTDDPVDLMIDQLPADLEPGFYHLVASRAGIPSLPRLVRLDCSLAITDQPDDAVVELGQSATFRVADQGGRFYQWRRDGLAIPGATAAEYVTPAVEPGDLGARYDVVVTGSCTSRTSDLATLGVVDDLAPTASISDPDRGDYWVLPLDGEPEATETVAWSMSDDVRICRVDLWLEASTDSGATPAVWRPIDRDDGGDPEAPLVTFGDGPACAQAVETRNHQIVLGLEPPSLDGASEGLDYRIRLRVRDHAENEVTAVSDAFSILRPDPEALQTLILTHGGRLRARFGAPEVEALTADLQRLAGHNKVDGLVVDLAGRASIDALYAQWDEAVADGDPSLANLAANELLFGPGGIHDELLSLRRAFPGVLYLVIAGDDSVIPMTRMRDDANLLDERSYEGSGGDLDFAASPDDAYRAVALAARGDTYLTDDPLTIAEPVDLGRLPQSLFLPDLAVGRLVETPHEMRRTIDAFLDVDGAVDLGDDRRVLVSGYDFLLDVATGIEGSWTDVVGADRVSSATVGSGWSAVDLEADLCDARGTPTVLSFNGHAHHRGEGVPGSSWEDIQALDAAALQAIRCAGEPLDLSGRIIYSVGCHAGLPVPGDEPSAHPVSRDLAQTYLGLGAVAYVANSGYGWGLADGVGYGERLVQILTEELTHDPDGVAVGRAVARTKLRYYLERLYFDPYDAKSLMQWTVFGLPMATLRTGGAGSDDPLPPVPRTTVHGASIDPDGRVTLADGVEPERPADLVIVESSIDLRAAGLYSKRTAEGEALAPWSPGDPAADEGCPEGSAGCYYALNGLASARGTGAAGLPLLPYVVYDTRFGATSQHGALWMGGRYVEEGGWRPLFATLVSNGGVTQNEPVPQAIILDPIDTRWPDEEQTGGACRTSDLETSTVAVTAAELLPGTDGEPYARHRRFDRIDLEIFYLGAGSPHACDREPPQIEEPPTGAYHVRSGSMVEWEVPTTASDDVWRVVVVVDDGEGQWRPVELERDGDIWRGSFAASALTTLRYVVQAVDLRGNVSWRRTSVQLEARPEARPEGGSSSSDMGPERLLPTVYSAPPAIAEPADLAVTLTPRPAAVEPGSPVDLDLQVVNDGPSPAAVRLEVELPDAVSVQGTFTPLWSCSVGNLIVCDRSTLVAPGETAALTLEAQASSAPDVAGQVHSILARVSHAGPDPVPSNDEATAELTILGDPPPTIDAVATVAATPDDRLDMHEVIDIAVTQLVVSLSEPVVGAANGMSWRLVEAGDDGRLQTDDCTAPAEDDIDLPLTVASQEPEPSSRYALAVGTAASPSTASTGAPLSGTATSSALPPGAYRLLVCPGVEDADGVPLEAPLVVRDFHVRARHLLENPNVDGDLHGWSVEIDGGAAVDVDPRDVGQTFSSKAARVLASGDDLVVLHQCRAVEPEVPVRLGGKVFVAHMPARVSLAVDEMTGPACTGEVVATVEAIGQHEPDLGWTPLEPLELVPTGSSLRVQIFVEPDDGGTIEVLLDDLVFRVADDLFLDGFESGDTEAWDGTSP